MLEKFKQIPLTIKRSTRKTLAIHILRDGSVEVRAAHSTAEAAIQQFIKKKSSWILKKQQEVRQSAQALPNYQYQNGEEFQLLGRTLTLQVQKGSKTAVEISGSHLILHTSRVGDKAFKAAKLKAWYKNQARELFAKQLTSCLARTAFITQRPMLRLRWMKAGWGSCSSRGFITLNIHLMAAHPDLINYVIFHELCHLKEANHSPRFYGLLARYCPEWKGLRKELNRTVFTRLI